MCFCEGDLNQARPLNYSRYNRWIVSVQGADINKNIFLHLWCLLMSSLLPPLQLLVNSEDAGASLVVLMDQETPEVFFVELLKPHSHTQVHTQHTLVHSWSELHYLIFLHMVFAAIYWWIYLHQHKHARANSEYGSSWITGCCSFRILGSGQQDSSGNP